ncbi:hypothetical protein R6Q59_006530 [Mikania micrantha]
MKGRIGEDFVLFSLLICRFPAQLSVVGLSEGLITFTRSEPRIFSPEAACEIIEAEMHSHVFFEAEPDIWMVMIFSWATKFCYLISVTLKGTWDVSCWHIRFMHGKRLRLLGYLVSGPASLYNSNPWLTPRILSSGGSTWSYLRKGNASSHAESAFDRLHGFQDGGSSARGDNYQIVRPLQHGKWSKGKDGFLVTDVWGVEASSKINKVEEKLSKGWGGENAYHVKGYRYLLVDGDRNISRASPSGKVSTLTKESLLTLNKVREDVDLERSITKGDDLEICIRAKTIRG